MGGVHLCNEVYVMKMHILLSGSVNLRSQSLTPQGQRFGKLSITFDNSNSLRNAHFLLKSGFQVVAFFIFLAVAYLVTVVVNLGYKWAWQLFPGHYYGHVALIFFKVGYQNNWYQILTWLFTTCQDKKR